MNGEVKWKAGDVLVNRLGEPSAWPAMFEGNDELQRHYEHGGWRLKDQPVARQLAPGWKRDDDYACDHPDCDNDDGSPVDDAYVKMINDLKLVACGIHAEAAGVFADAPTPAKRQLMAGWEECTTMGCYPCFTKKYKSTASKLRRRDANGNSGFCDVCAEEAGAFAVVTKVSCGQPVVEDEFPVCRDDCGEVSGPPQYPHTDAGRSGFFSGGKYKTGARWCTAACRDAKRPINPVQMVQVDPMTIPAVAQAVDRIMTCGKCAHRHVGACDGKSPGGEFGCPCGHLTEDDAKLASRGAYAVGKYDDTHQSARAREIASTTRSWERCGGYEPAATLLSNLAREKPPRRELPKVRSIYLPGVSDEG